MKQVPQRPHRYWGGTACPGARYKEWQPQLTARAKALLQPDQPEQEEDDMPVLIQNPAGVVAIAEAGGKRLLGPTENSAWKKALARGPAVELTDAQFDAIPPLTVGGGGLTAAQMRDILKQKDWR